MHIDGQAFLITTCEPLQLTLQCPITSESQNQLGLGLQGQLNILQSRGFIPTIIHTDPARGFTSLVGAFPGVIFDPSGAGDHVAKVDAKIRRIKELYRSVKNGLPWKLPSTMVKDLVAYAVARLNIKRTTAINQNVCPRVLFTGIKVNYKKELTLAFGDYCEVYDGTDNTSASRSIPCIALYPNNNSTGSWNFMNLQTKQRVRRSQWKLMVTTELIIDVMIFFEDKRRPAVPLEQEAVEPQVEPTAVIPEVVQEQVADNSQQEDATENLEEQMPDLIDHTPDENSDSEDENSDSEEEEEQPEQEQGIASRTRRRTGTQVNPPERYTLASVKLNKKKETGERKAAIDQADKDELELLFVQLRGLLPRFKEELNGEKAFNSHMFTVEKFLASGVHDKFKSRLVFDGSEQDPELFPDRSSPTAALHSLMACLALASANGMTRIGKIDVKGAFIQTEMEGPPIYVKISPETTRLIVELLPGVKQYVTPEGILYCQLLKALYGCVQASKLWYNKLTKFLRTLGYDASPTDPCIMRKIVDDKIYLLVIYVDDILVLAEESEIERIRDAFIQAFQWITMEVNDSHSYLGMQIIMKKGFAVIDMSHFIERLLDSSGETNLRKFMSPAGKDIFSVQDKATLLPEPERKMFHTSVAKLLYLSKRSRPDILTAVGFLCTRVTRATVQDRLKLRRVLGYLKRTKQKTLHLKIGDFCQLQANVDAAFASHPDAKSQSGLAIFMGKALLFAASRKQKCVSKSPTDSELIALSDNIQFIELFAEFIAFITNTDIQSPMIFEDCTAVITLVTEGGGVMRTKHLRVRMELCKQALREGKVKIQYVNTKQMIADGLTKALEGEDFIVFAEHLLGTSLA